MLPWSMGILQVEEACDKVKMANYPFYFLPFLNVLPLLPHPAKTIPRPCIPLENIYLTAAIFTPKFNILVWYFFLIIGLADSRPTLGHWKWGSLSHPMLITHYVVNSTQRSPAALEQGSIPEPVQIFSVVWTSKHLILNVMP